jgi:DnaJ homolog subfamily B member 4
VPLPPPLPLALLHSVLFLLSSLTLLQVSALTPFTISVQVPQSEILEINVRPGWKAGTKLTFASKGDEDRHGQAGDIIFVIKEKPHERFTRHGDDLHTAIKVPLVQALTGAGDLAVTTLDGRAVRLPHRGAILTPGTEISLPGEGMPNSKTGQKGALKVKFDIEFPKSLTDQQKEGIKAILGGSA